MSTDYDKSSAARERVVVAAYSFYSAAAIFASFVYDWANWAAPIIIMTTMLSIVCFGAKFRSYRFRALFTTICAWANFTITIVNTRNFLHDLSLAAALIVLVAVYCVPELSYISTAVFSLHLVYYLVRFDMSGADESDTFVSVFMHVAAVYLIILLTNLTTRNLTESNRQLRETIETVQRAEQTKDDFLANVSHEIRTPVNTICGISEIILRDDLPETVREEITDIRNAGQNMLSIVSDIMDFTEISAGESELTPVTYSVTSTMNDIINMVISSASGKKLETIVTFDADIPSSLMGDEDKIRRAVLNVLDNAVKFTREGGIMVKVGCRREEYGVNLIVNVRDTGIGMTDEQLEKLFTPYSQANTKRNRSNSGLGLGLLITKSIVNRMGGFITVKSQFGMGTEVQLVFPQRVLDQSPSVSLENPEKYRILLYLDMDKYANAEIRNAYEDCIRHIVEDLHVSVNHCRNLAEMKRRGEAESYTHVFVSWNEYTEDKEYFDRLSERMTVVLVMDRDHRESVSGRNIAFIYKPFYVMSIAAVLSGQYARTDVGYHGRGARFTAPNARIMVVDDNLMNLKVTEGLLRPYKVKVHLAESGAAALDNISKFKPDIIFMDHMMPEMDGIETFHRIRDRVGIYYQNVPVVALTANAAYGAREMFLNEGFADYITKPIELTLLERVLRTYIPESKIIKAMAEEEMPVRRETTGLTLEGIDTAMGLGYCAGNLEDYIDVLRIYYEIGASRINDIRRFFAEKDWENYTILVHAVKSTSLNIGAAKLSGMAERLEIAGKRSDVTEITAGSDAMLTEYERVLGVIKGSRDIYPEVSAPKPDPSQLREITPEELESRFDELSRSLGTFEAEAVDHALTELEQCTFGGESLSALLSGIRSKASGFDFIGADEELAELRRKLR